MLDSITLFMSSHSLMLIGVGAIAAFTSSHSTLPFISPFTAIRGVQKNRKTEKTEEKLTEKTEPR